MPSGNSHSVNSSSSKRKGSDEFVNKYYVIDVQNKGNY